jgi:tetratricopeptide (TPR) repeat protein
MKRSKATNSATRIPDRTANVPEGGIPVAVVFLILLALHIVPLVIGHPMPWGMDQWAYIPGTVTAALIAFGLLALVPGFRGMIILTARGIGRFAPIAWISRHGFIGYPVLLVLSAALFWYFRNATHFLGDGYLWAGHLTTDIVFNEPASSYMYRAAFKLLNGSWHSISVQPVTASAIISIAAGLVFVVFALLTARLVSEGAGQQSVLLLSLFSGGSILLFFGYVEPYPPYAAAVMAYVYFGLRYLRGRSAMIAPIVTLVIAHALHFSAAAMLPSLALLIWIGSGRRIRRKRLYGIIAAAIPIGLAILWALRYWRVFGGFFFDTFIPLFPGFSRSRFAYPLFSWKTLFESFNHIILVCPAAFLILAGIAPSSRRSRRTERGDGAADPNGTGGTKQADRSKGSSPGDGPHDVLLVFLETIVIFYILEFIIFNKNIGASRDWDLFAPLAIPLAILVGLHLIEWFPRSAGAIAVYLFAVLAFHTAPWIVLNASREISERRFEDLVDTGYWSGYAKGYGYSTLGIYFERVGNRERGIAFSRKAIEADPKNPRYWYNLATCYYREKRFDAAVELYRKVIDHDPGRLEARNNLGVVYSEMGRIDLAEREFSSILRSDSTYLQCYEPLSYVYFQLGRLEECRRLYRKALALGHDMTPFFKEMTWVHRGDGEIEKSIHILEIVLEVVRTDPDLYFNAAKMYRTLGNHERSLDYFGVALRLAPNNRDFNMEYALELYLSGRREKALNSFLRLYERDAGDIRVINNIGVIYSEGEEHDKAVTFFERAVELRPDNADLRINLARTYIELGRYRKAWEQVVAAERLGAAPPPALLENLQRAMPRP